MIKRHSLAVLALLSMMAGPLDLISQKLNQLRIDGSSTKSFHRSEQALMSAMSPSQKRRYDRAILRLMTTSAKLGHKQYLETMRQRLHGMTVDQILAAGNTLTTPRRGIPMNERAVRTVLKRLCATQKQLMASAKKDGDADNRGEYGYFGELSGVVDLPDKNGRPGSQRLSPSPLSSRWGKLSDGVVEVGGYFFQMFLPDENGLPVPEGIANSTASPDMSERVWCCYAWPVKYGATGMHAYFVNQSGDIHVSDNKKRRYSGRGKRPLPMAAFKTGKKRMTDFLAFGTGNDGQVWQPPELGIEKNERTARRVLQILCADQIQMQTQHKVFGYFGELAGVVGIRDKSGRPTRRRLPQPILSRAWGKLKYGHVVYRGYVFQMFLPDEDGQPVPEGASKRYPSSKESAEAWCCFAWPLEYGVTGKKTFFVNQDAKSIVTDNSTKKYSGHANVPHPMAAFKTGTRKMTGTHSLGGTGKDGQTWTVLD